MGISPKYDKTLVLNADMPLIQANELEKFDLEGTIVMSVLNLKSAQGYGRVIIENENVKRVVEQKDATERRTKNNNGKCGSLSV